MSLIDKLREFSDLQNKQYELGLGSTALITDWRSFEDFFKQLGKQKAIFAELAALIEAFVSIDGKDHFSVFMNIVSLTKKLRTGLLKPVMNETVSVIKSVEDEVIYRTDSWHTLKPIIRSLSTKGGGRLKALQKAQALNYYQNRQLLPYLIDAAGDSYTAVSSLALDELLPFFGEAGVRAVQESLDYGGGRSEFYKYTFLKNRLSSDELEKVQRAILGSSNLAFKKHMLVDLSPLQWMRDDLEALLSSRSRELAGLARKAFEKLS